MDDPVRIVCRPELAVGFALAGLPTEEVESAEEGARRIQVLVDDEAIGVLLAERAFVDALPDSARAELWRRPRPIVVPFDRPGWTEAEAAEDVIVEILRRAVGYRVRLQ